MSTLDTQDLGVSIATGRPVLGEVSRAVVNSLILASVATVIGFTFGDPGADLVAALRAAQDPNIEGQQAKYACHPFAWHPMAWHCTAPWCRPRLAWRRMAHQRAF